ncbi:unnamed protein product [Prorocentrum cordatum]|uniref:Reverse transcriptase domain-containing protein n=1 Tax=Prorocentrum cordatum TaxID=2364126 RepID=A0ABN9SXG2_9DINO|nr:unnamed protein product [Polarella glacialis]
MQLVEDTEALDKIGQRGDGHGGKPSANYLDVRRLPQEVKQEMVDIANVCDTAGCWPRNWIAVLAATVPKLAGGDRVLDLLPLLPKAWSKARGAIVWTWTEELGAFWDGVIKDSSLLRAALHRAVLDETGRELGTTSTTLWCDLQTFYDAISLMELMDLAVQVRYPAIVVSMAVQLSMAPRLLQDRKFGISQEVRPTRSVVAGSVRGVSLATVYIHQVLAKAHAMAPTAGLSTFADDTTAKMEGSQAAVTTSMTVIAEVLVEGIVEERGPVISSKTKLLCSNPRFGKQLADSLRSKRLPIQAVQEAVDLGGGAAVGRKRCVRKQRQRTGMARRRTARIVKTRRTAALMLEDRNLWSTGANPQASYGHQLQGLAPSRIKEIRRRRDGRWQTGGRPMSHHGPGGDAAEGAGHGWSNPAVGESKGPAGARPRWWTSAGSRTAVPWVRPEHQAQWAQPVRIEEGGPASEWHLVEATGEAFGSLIDHRVLLHSARRDMVHMMWRAAAGHEGELRRMARRQQLTEWSLNMAVASGSQWPSTRRRREGFL